MWHDEVQPGENERKELLLSQPEVEVSEDEFDNAFSVHCKNEELVKREVEGKLAEDIRKRFGAEPEAKVFITELEADVKIGDETWDHFKELVIECDGNKIDFENHMFTNAFVQMLNWLKEDPDSTDSSN
jgi:hypothetical protein